MPAYIKGGIWTNVEDEILRAAISKYGLNQWSRVSSLLARKTAKQAKARWYEWLDPSIKKIEWSREEDEKLLHLAKLMPTQWRTIASIVGRTATQCLERYQRLLDDAETRESGELGLTGAGSETAAPEASSSTSNILRLKAGEIDTNPESKPARPDAIDMDEDEKEMLSEARARLANTQGKKAKRKQRERLLEESRRLAVLQKRRELKSAGISTSLAKRPKYRSGQMDYNVDIPFEHKPAPGFFDTSEEDARNLREKEAFDARAYHKGIQRDKADEQKNEKKRNRNQDGENKKRPSAAQEAAMLRAEKLQQIQQAEQQSKRRKLVLPAPQVSESELHEIIKLSKHDNLLSEKYGDESLGATGTLVSRYNTHVGATASGTMGPPGTTRGLPQRTPQVPSAQDQIYQASRDLRALNETQSAILGQENTPLHDGSGFGFKGVEPERNVSATPNPFVTPRNETMELTTATPMRRDGLGLNETSFGEATPRETIRRRFASLPKPRNEFELELPNEQQQQQQTAVIEAKEETDAGERERFLAQEAKRKQEQELAKRSSVLKFGLPRPIISVSQYKNKDDKLLRYREIVNEQVLRQEVDRVMEELIVSDSIKYPLDDKTNIKIDPTIRENLMLDNVQDDVKESVDELITQVVNQDLSQYGIDFPSKVSSCISKVITRLQYANCKKFSLVSCEYDDDGDDGDVSKEPIVVDDKFSKELYGKAEEQLTLIATKCNKIQDKLMLQFGGYLNRNKILNSKVDKAAKIIQDKEIELECYKLLQNFEKIAINNRLSKIQQDVEDLLIYEGRAQDRYRELSDCLHNRNATKNVII